MLLLKKLLFLCENCKKLINEVWGKIETFKCQSDATYGNGCGVCG